MRSPSEEVENKLVMKEHQEDEGKKEMETKTKKGLDRQTTDINSTECSEWVGGGVLRIE